MATGYYFTMKRHKNNIMTTGIQRIHPSGICLCVKPNQDEPDAEAQNEALRQSARNMATTIAKLHDCDRANMFAYTIIFEVEYDESDVTIANDNYIVINTSEIPGDKVKYIGGFDTLGITLA